MQINTQITCILQLIISRTQVWTVMKKNLKRRLQTITHQFSNKTLCILDFLCDLSWHRKFASLLGKSFPGSLTGGRAVPARRRIHAAEPQRHRQSEWKVALVRERKRLQGRAGRKRTKCPLSISCTFAQHRTGHPILGRSA